MVVKTRRELTYDKDGNTFVFRELIDENGTTTFWYNSQASGGYAPQKPGQTLEDYRDSVLKKPKLAA